MAYWTGAAGDGRWANPGNWSGGKVPNMGLGAVISSGATIAIADGDNTDWFQVNGADPVVLVGGALNTPAILSQGASPLQIGCRLTPAGALTVSGEIQVISGGSIAVTNGGWKQSGNLTLSANSSILFARSASATVSMTGHLSNNGGSITLNGGALNITGNLVNSGGTINIANGGIVTPTGLFTAGTFNFTNGQLNCSAPWNVTGDITLALAPGTTNRMYVGVTTNVMWSGIVNITGFTPGAVNNRITIGNNKACATQAQIAAINFVGDSGNSPAYLNSYGWVLPDGAITITSQPSSVTTNASSQVAFSIGYFSKYPVSFQWQKNGQNISGATGPSYTISTASTDHSGTYNVLLKSSTTTDSSRSASLSVLTTTIIQQPANQNVAYGSALNLSVSVTNANAPITYQWYHNAQTISGANASSYAKEAVSSTDAGDYTVAITSPSGSVSSMPAHVTVGPVITQQPSTVLAKCGQIINLSVSADGSQPLVYQWLQDGQQIAGATASTFSIASAAGTNAGSYTVVVSNPAGSVSSAPAVVTVVPADPPVITLSGLANGTTFTNGTTLNFGYNITDPNGSAIAGVGLVRDGTMWSTDAVSMGGLTWTPASGTHTLIATATNAYGTTAKLTTTLTIAAPLGITITSPQDNQYFSQLGYQTIAASVAGGLNVTGVVFAVDGTNIATLTQGPWQTKWLLQSGIHTIRATASDNYAETASASISVSANLTNGFDIAPLSEGGTITDGSAVDGNDTTYANLPDSSTPIPRIYPVSRTVLGIRIYAAAAASIPATLLIETSADGTAWTTSGTVTVTPGATWINWSPAAPITTAYIRLRTANYKILLYTWNIWGDINENSGDPIGQIVSPTTGTTVNAPQYLPFHVLGSDPDGYVAKAELYVDNSLVQSATGTNDFTLYWNTGPSNHAAYARIQDNMGRWRNTPTNSFNVVYDANFYDIAQLSEGGTITDARAVDGNDTTYASLPDSSTPVSRVFPTARTVFGIRFYARTTASIPASLVVETSADGTVWTALGDKLTVPPAVPAWRNWSPAAPIKTPYIRLRSPDYGAVVFTWTIWGDHNENPNDPVGQVVSPAAGSTITVPQRLPVQIIASDADGYVGNVGLYVDDSLIQSSSGTNAFTLYWNTSPGTHTVYASVQDNMGRIRFTPTNSVTVAYANNFYDIAPLSEGGTITDARAVDGNDTTYSANSTLVSRAFPPARTVYGIRFYARTTASIPASLVVETSADGTVWTTLSDKLTVPPAVPAWLNWAPAAPIKTPYIRLRSPDYGAVVYTWTIWGDTQENPVDPSGLIVSPANGSTVDSPLAVPIQVVAQDDGYVANASVYVDGTSVASGSGSNSFTLYWTETSLGAHKVYASIQDNMGRIRNTPTNSFTVAYATNFYDIGPLSEGGGIVNSYNGSGGGAGANAVDNNNGTYANLFGTGYTLTRSWPTPRTLDGMAIYAYGGTCYIDLSYDNTNWVTVQTISTGSSPASWFYWAPQSSVKVYQARLRGGLTVFTWNIWGDLQDDPVLPTGTITSPLGGSTFNNPLAIAFQVSSTAYGYVSNAFLYVDGNQVASATGSNSFSIQWNAVSQGAHSAYVRLQDNIGRFNNTPTVSFQVAYTTNFYDIGPLSEGGSIVNSYTGSGGGGGSKAVDNNDGTYAYLFGTGYTLTRSWPTPRTLDGMAIYAYGGTCYIDLSYDNTNWVTVQTISTGSSPASWFYWSPQSPVTVYQARLRGGLTVFTWNIWGNSQDNGATTQTTGKTAIAASSDGSTAATTADGVGAVTAADTTAAEAPTVYNGLFYEQTGIVWNHAGAVTITVDTTSSFEGTVLTKGQSYTIGGELGTNGQADITIARTNDTTLSLSFNASQGNLTGTVGDSNWTSTLEGEAVSSAPSTPAGFNLLLNDGSLGNGTVQIGTNSVSQMQFTLLDGTTVTESCGISITGQWPVYQALYNGQGGVLGWFKLTPTNVTGTAIWWNGATNSLSITGYPLPNTVDSGSSQ